MIVTISQPRYIPFLGYFHRIYSSDLFIYLDTVQYTPRDWENRNKIKTEGGWTWLTVPVHAAYKALIPEVRIDEDRPWRKKHWLTIESFYKRAPHFESLAPGMKDLYDHAGHGDLTELNVAFTSFICEMLGPHKTSFVRSSSMSVSGRGSELILNLCNEVGASVYLSGSEGRNYLDEAAFAAVGIAIRYQEYVHPVYPQLHGPFEPNMSALDLLLNCGPQSLNILMTDSLK